jgi:hypothetical protein
VALAANNQVVSRRFLMVLYARMVIFRIFLEQALAMPGRITEEHKGRWLLLQVAPETLLAEPDIFSALVQLLGRASSDYLRESAQHELVVVRRLFGPRPPALFCVLDEAQIPTNKFSDCFRSDTEAAEPRPILRPIISTWTDVLPNLIVSGTGISMQQLETVLGSVVAKVDGVPPPETVTDLGAFDSEEDQRAYFKCYLPPGFLDTEAGEVLAS